MKPFLLSSVSGLAVLASILCLSMDPVWALKLGDYVEPQSPSLKAMPDGKSFQMRQQVSPTVTVVGLVNKNQRVYAIQIESSGEMPPDPQEYLGDYASFKKETVRVIPLRGRVVRFSQGDRKAEWSVYGLSGRFSAQAVSLDLAPSDLINSYKADPTP